MRLPRCETLMTSSLKPARASASMTHAISGLPPASSSGLGVRVGERAHALAAARREDHRFHESQKEYAARGAAALDRVEELQRAPPSSA